MSISAPFIRRPVGTSLLAAALLLSGILAFNYLPVSSLPRVDFPVISVGAQLPGADPQTMASAVATPLERQFGRIAAINQMTSTSQLGSTSIVLQFDLNRNIDAAARDVQAASMFRFRSNCKTMLVEPAGDSWRCLIWLISGDNASKLPVGAAAAEATVCGSAPGSCAPTLIRATRTPRNGREKSSDVPTGRRINGAEILMF